MLKLCRNAKDALGAWYCQSFGSRPATVNKDGLCGHCAKAAEWDGLNEPPSFMLADADL